VVLIADRPDGARPTPCAVRAFERHQRFLQRPGGRRAVAAVLKFTAVGMQIVRGRIQHGGTVDHGRIDEPLLRVGVAAGRHQRGFRAQRVRPPVIA